MTEFLSTIPKGLTLATIIFFGAVVHATVQLKVARERRDLFTWKDFIILIPISMFSGWFFSGMALWILPNGTDTFVSICAGLGAFLGLAGLNRGAAILMDILEGLIRKK